MGKNKKKLLVGGIAVCIIAIAVILIAISSTGYSVDLSKMYAIKFEGLEGEGYAEIVFNEQEQNTIANEIGSFAESSEAIDNFLSIEYEILPCENLSNGDTVKVIAKYSESFFDNYKIKFTNSDMEYEVEGLVIPEEIDVFEGLKVDCEGISPFITCSFDTTNCSDFAKDYVDFETAKNQYSVGESIEVIANYDEEDCVEEKVKVIKESSEYKAESKAYYLESVEGIDLTSLLDAFSKQLKLEYDSADELFCNVELGWTNRYTGVKDEQKKDEFCLVLRETASFDDEIPYNIYGVYYRIKIGVEHRSRGNEGTFDTEIDVLLLAKNLYIDEDNVLHYDDLIEVRAEEVDGSSNLMSEYIKVQQGLYKEK